MSNPLMTLVVEPLRDGLLFHDGEKVRGIDAVASIERASKRGPLTGTMMAAINAALRRLRLSAFVLRTDMW